METRNTIIEQLNIFWKKILHIVVNMSWWTEVQSEIIVLSILGYLALLFLLLFIHRKIIKKHKKIYENIVFLYDTIRYQVTKAQYGNTAIQQNKWINLVLQSDHKNYLSHTKEIKEEIIAIEQQLGQQIITEDQRKNINKQIKRKRWVHTMMQSIGRFITVITAGIYKLFW